LLKAFASAAIDDDQGARALGERVARQLRDAGATDYLSAA
jgi:hypothetical protein